VLEMAQWRRAFWRRFRRRGARIDRLVALRYE